MLNRGSQSSHGHSPGLLATGCKKILQQAPHISCACYQQIHRIKAVGGKGHEMMTQVQTHLACEPVQVTEVALGHLGRKEQRQITKIIDISSL